MKPKRILFSVGSDFLGQWLPVCIARAMPDVECRFVGRLWTDGVYVRESGQSYCYLPWARMKPLAAEGAPSRRALLEMLTSQIERSAPDALVYLTAESMMGAAAIEAARGGGIPAVGLQTFFDRGALLVHTAGQDWWRALRDRPLGATAPMPALPVSSIDRAGGRRDRLVFQSLAWASRAERLLRMALGAASVEESAAVWSGRLGARGAFPDLGTPDVLDAPPRRHVLVALHRPRSPVGCPDWIGLIRFALAATPPDVPLVLRPHPMERGLPLPADLIDALRARGVRVSRPGRGAAVEALLPHARAVITINSAVGMQALMAGVPAVTIGPAYYARPGMASAVDPARPESLLDLIARDALPAPDRAVVDAFVKTIARDFASPMPAVSARVCAATALAERIFAAIESCERVLAGRREFSARAEVAVQ